MAAIMPVAPVGWAVPSMGAVSPAMSSAMSSAMSPGPYRASFGDLMMAGLRDIDAKVANADTLIQAFARGDSIPVHQVTLALENARLSVELAMQVRTRLVESYRDLMNMQI